MSRVLLVDNEREEIEPLRLLLESERYHVATALDGWEAFELTNGRPPDIVVTDWHMPRVDGLTFCRMLRHANPTLRMPVILMSSEAPPADRGASLYTTGTYANRFRLTSFSNCFDDWLPGAIERIARTALTSAKAAAI